MRPHAEPRRAPPTDPPPAILRFPPGFLWGISTAGFLMEGAPEDDGAGLSVQHTFARTPGNRPDGTDLDRGVSHYHRAEEDVALAKQIGVQSLRFSIAWPRVVPTGTGTVNQRGLDHYDALIDRLLSAGITPFPYLYLWDLPAALQDRGGWANRDSAHWFADYASVVFDRLGDRVGHWFTVCEPWSIVHFGHVVGENGPGVRDLRTAMRAGHHLLLGHGRAVEAFRASGAEGGIGLSTVMTDIQAASQSPADRAAAERAEAYFNRLYLDPVLVGTFPEVPESIARHLPEPAVGDLATISTPIDFLGVVYYLRLTVADPGGDGADAEPDTETDGSAFEQLSIGELAALQRNQAVFSALLDIEVVDDDGPTTEMGWTVAPRSLRNVLHRVRDRYGNPPVYVAENGAVFPDPVADDGTINDADRSDYIRDHLRAAHEAIGAGVDLRGWSVWSLLDDPDDRFGLVRVDPQTHDRTVKASGHWYRGVIEANGVPAD